jgi:hypothetical protein
VAGAAAQVKSCPAEGRIRPSVDLSCSYCTTICVLHDHL